ncbi:expressed protein [Chlorella variabilis]|uniref:Expressed protein n=1 Tax=Chlorella variabilis TaxID=554065 RepID=E1ZLY1_CHLVA|nr:expressed protein [Chlorella variabilis]EFN53347.1 expressed protein [Chlorella variabilis]|eukprot:XP_005845449.1 expressed protein [Chlorella variabilis]
MSLKKQTAGIWPLALWSLAATAMLLFAVSGSGGLGSVQRRMLLARPLATGDLTGLAVLDHLVSGRVGGASANLLAANTTAYKRANERCRAPTPDSPPLPKLKRAGAWDGGKPAVSGNATAIVTLHIDRLPLLQAHCAVWPHTVMAVVYAPISSARRFTCVDEVATPDQLRRGSSWLAMLGLGGGRCQYSGWSLERLRARVRDMQKRAEETGVCNLQAELWTEEMTEQLGAGAGLIPQAALQNKALLALQQQEQDLDKRHAVVLLDSDIAAVDVWQLLNSSSRWERAAREMGGGGALVLPAFQLSPPRYVHEGAGGGAATLRGRSLESAVKNAMTIVTADAGKFPLRKKFVDGKVRVFSDRGFSSSQDAALPLLWFEAGDMHGDDDDGYPIVPQPGFAPFTMMRRQHVPWGDERLRGSYYHRAWQALVARYMGVRHIVQPNTFTLQLPHTQAFSMGEASLTNFLAMEPVFRQLVEEMGMGVYVPITSFGDDCQLNLPYAEVY